MSGGVLHTGDVHFIWTLPVRRAATNRLKLALAQHFRSCYEPPEGFALDLIGRFAVHSAYDDSGRDEELERM